MAYQSLYRRYRPRRFSDHLVGQSHVVTALRNAVREGRTGHAYLFSGPRGTGKTTTARILAKALNCTALDEGEPCGECESCRSIDAGTSYDLFELDAASNNKVEDVRDLISRVAIGSPGRTKVYILDEVHMLSAAASNALLKTLEEPPDHVTFVLATTDPQKVLPTIRSRTQQFEFGLIPAPELEAHLRWVIADAGLTVDDDAVAWVVRKAAGSARDALSALEQVAAAGGVRRGALSLDELLEALCERDTTRALVGVAAAMADGREPRLVAEDLLGRLREIFLSAVAPDLSQLPDLERERAADAAKRLGAAGTTRALEVVGEAVLEMRQAPDPRVALEVALVRLTRPDLDVSVSALVERIARLEAALAGGAFPTSGPPAAVPAAGRTGGSAPSAGAAEAPHAPAPAPAAERPAPPADRSAPARPPAGRPAPTVSSASGDRAAREGAAALARRRLAETRGTPPPGRSTASGPGPRGAAAATPSLPTAPSSTAPTASTPPTSVGDAAGTGATGSSGEAPTLEEITDAWGTWVLDNLPPGVRALYRAGRFVGVEGGRATFALPSAVHRDRCEGRRGEVETRLGERLGRSVPLRLVVEEGGPAGFGRDEPDVGDDDPPAAGGLAGRDDPDEFGSIDDIRALPDATDLASSTLERLLEVFPGAEVVE